MEKKKSVGRPKIVNNPKKKFIIYVDSRVYKFYKEKGSGSVSRGIKLVHDAILNFTK
jgi:uncharacterized protein (DUF4415 family)